MPTQEERLSTLEQTVTVLKQGMQDLNHHVTILLGVTSEQGKDIRGIRVNLAALNERVDAFEQNVNTRFEALDSRVSGLDDRIGVLDSRVSGLDGRIGALDNRVSSLDRRVSGLDGRIEAFEQSVNSRFEEQGKKLDQVLFLLNSVIPRSEQGT